MNDRQARDEGLVLVESSIYRKFWGGDKEKLKEVIAKTRKEYKVRIVMVSTQTSGGFHRHFSHKAYAEPILLDYLFLEQSEDKAAELEKKRKQIEEEYRFKLQELEEQEISLNDKIHAAMININKREKIEQ